MFGLAQRFEHTTLSAMANDGPKPPELTLRAVVTGMLLGGILAPSNIYAGLKIGWGFNMSITAALLGFGAWHAASRATGARPFNVLENTINQTAASSGAMIASAGLVAAVPALTLLTGYEWRYLVLVAWTFAVSLLGVGVALILRRQMLVVEKLPFPSGFVTGITLEEMYSRGEEAIIRLKALLGGALAGGTFKVATDWFSWSRFSLPFGYRSAAGTALAEGGIRHVTLGNLTFALDPSPLMLAVGVIIGPRAGTSLLLGALVAWGVLGPWALSEGLIPADAVAALSSEGASISWFGPMVEWLLWPGVAMMVAAALTSTALSWRSFVSAFRHTSDPTVNLDSEPSEDPSTVVSQKAIVALLVAGASFAWVLQIVLFDIAWWAAALGILLTFVLATVAARVTGETDITPIGAMGKITQLFFGVVAPGGVTANLMAANVTGGAASQCADMLQDLRSGKVVGSSPRAQAVAQAFGVASGALAGSGAYLLLIPNPDEMLFTDEWAAPAVATWKAVAEVFATGVGAMPEGSVVAMGIGAGVGTLLSVVERFASERAKPFVPSAASMGLAMVIPAFYAISMFAGAMLGVLSRRVAPGWSSRLLLIVAAGVIAGESIVGVASATSDALLSLLSG
jgi:OPT family oligopeptide transporter